MPAVVKSPGFIKREIGELAAMLERKFILAIDGSESQQGRALFSLSALSFCQPWGSFVDFRLIDVEDENVVLMAEVLRWDEGLSIDIWTRQDAIHRGSPLADADLYVGVVFRSADHMRLTEAEQYGVPVALAVQYPEANATTCNLLTDGNAAFDSRALAASLGCFVQSRLNRPSASLPPLSSSLDTVPRETCQSSLVMMQADSNNGELSTNLCNLVRRRISTKANPVLVLQHDDREHGGWMAAMLATALPDTEYAVFARLSGQSLEFLECPNDPNPVFSIDLFKEVEKSQWLVRNIRFTRVVVADLNIYNQAIVNLLQEIGVPIRLPQFLDRTR